jgi:hypothetical protein
MTDLTESKQDRTFFDKNESMNAHSFDRIVGHPVRDCRTVLGLSHLPANNKFFVGTKYDQFDDKVKQDIMKTQQDLSDVEIDERNATEAVSCVVRMM